MPKANIGTVISTDEVSIGTVIPAVAGTSQL